MESDRTYKDIRRKLHKLRQREKILALFSGSFSALAVLVGIGFGLLASEAIFWFSTVVRTTLVAGFLVLGAIVVGWFIGEKLFSIIFRKNFPCDDHLALRVGGVFPHIKDRLTDALQVYRTRSRETHRTSSTLALAALDDINKTIKPLNFLQAASKEKFFQSMRYALFATAFCFLGIIIFSQSFGGALYRVVHPGKHFAVPAPFSLTLHPGNIRVIQGEEVKISVEGRGNVPSTVSLFLIENKERVEEKILGRPFFYQITSIKKSMDYFARAEKVQTQTFSIDVVQRPIVRMLQVKLFPPSYARLGIQSQEPNTGEVEALKGTNVRVLVKTNKILSKASLVFDKDKRKEMKIKKSEAAGEFIVKSEDRYWIELEDTLGIENSDPISYTVRVRPDLDPVARILFPGKNIDLDESMTVPLILEAEDDFGLSKCRIGYWINKSGSEDSSKVDTSFVPLVLEEKEPTRVVLNYSWNMEELNLFPEDVVSYYFEALDNDYISGPKSARSQTFTVRFPSIYEIFQEVEAEQNDQVETLMEMYGESKNFQDELKRISEEMKSGKKLEWEERKNLESMTENQQKMQEEIENLSERLNEVVDRMERNELLSFETLAKYQELQKLFEEISSPELLETMKKMQKVLEQIDEAELKKAMENFKLSQEGFLKAIERTISLLKRLQIEQKVDELIKRMEDLIQRQEDINQQLSQDDKSKISESIDNQKKIREDTEAFRQEMEKLFEKMGELPNMPLSELASTMELMDREKLLDQMEKMMQMMQTGEVSQACNSGCKAKMTMETMAEMLKKLQEDLQKNQKEKVANALRRASHRLIHLSQKQEALMQQAREGKSVRTRTAEDQLSLLSGLIQVLDSLYQLSQETFFVTPEMGKALGQAQSQMNQALQSMESANWGVVSGHQVKAMGGLNQAVMSIQDAMGQLGNASSGLGMQEFLLGLEQMGEQQLGINQQTMELLQQGRLTLEQQAAMSRLIAEQEAVKRQLEEYLREFGERSDIAGRLDRLVEDMEAVVRELKQNKANSETIRRQERILSRLLDAQHSLHRRDYSRMRQARTGKDVIKRSPSDLPPLDLRLKDSVRRDILRMAKEGYTQDYQKLIQRYFEALMEEVGR